MDNLIIFYFMPLSPYFSNLGSLSHPHGLEEAPVVHQLGPGHLVMLANLISGHFLYSSPFMPNLGSLSHPHGLEEAPVVHRHGPGHLPEVG